MKPKIRCYVRINGMGAVGGPYLNEVIAGQHLETLKARYPQDDLIVDCLDVHKLAVHPRVIPDPS